MITIEKNRKTIHPAINFRYTVLVLGLFILIPASLTAKDGPQSMLKLRQLALNYIQNQYEPDSKTRVTFSNWDTRIKLSKCKTSKIEVFTLARNNAWEMSVLVYAVMKKNAGQYIFVLILHSN